MSHIGCFTLNDRQLTVIENILHIEAMIPFIYQPLSMC